MSATISVDQLRDIAASYRHDAFQLRNMTGDQLGSHDGDWWSACYHEIGRRMLAMADEEEARQNNHQSPHQRYIRKCVCKIGAETVMAEPAIVPDLSDDGIRDTFDISTKPPRSSDYPEIREAFHDRYGCPTLFDQEQQ